jgi:hypothetical protein
VRQSPQEHIVKSAISTVLVWLSMGALWVAASAPVAMRVEVEPQRTSDGTTVVEVVVQVSPEDRTRVGANAIVRLELDGGTVDFGSPMRGVRFDSAGSARIEVAWPPGEHDLRVELEVPRSDATGLWVGKVRIPETIAGVSAAAAVAPVPAPEPESAKAPGKPEAPPKPTPESQADTVVAESVPPPASMPTAKVAATEATPVALAPPEVEVETLAGPKPQPEAVAAMTADETELAPAPASNPEPGVATPQPSPTPEVAVKSEPTVPAPTVAVKPEPTPTPPIVEPLRSNPPPAPAEPRTEPSGRASGEGAAGGVISAELATRYEAWEDADSLTREFTIIVTRAREPARDLGVEDLRLRIDGSEVGIERLGDAAHAPLLLGLAIDVSGGQAGGWANQGGTLEPLAQRVGGGRGRLFVATGGGVGGWGQDPEPQAGAAKASAAENVAQLIVASLAPFAGLRGRTFLVVLTDGRNEPTKTEWQNAFSAAGEAGVPVLVIVMWDQDFSPRTRKELKRIATVSGGSLFLVQGSDQLGSAGDRFSLAIDAGVAVRFKEPPGLNGGALQISVTSTEKDLEISAPESIR